MDAGLGCALGAALTWGASSFFAGEACRRRGTLTVLTVTQLAGLATMTLIAVIQATTAGIDLDAWRRALPWAGIAGMAELVGFAGLYRAMTAGPMGVATPVAGLGVVVPVLFGINSAGALGRWQVLGLVLVGVGIIALAADRTRIGARTLVLAAVSGLGFGIALVALAEGAAADEVAGGTLMRAVTVPLLLPVWWAFRHHVPATPGRHARPVGPLRSVPAQGLPWVRLAVLAGICDAMGNVAFALASTRLPLAAAAVLGSMDPVVTALMARLWLAERLDRVAGWGAAAAVLGAALTSVVG